MAELLAEVSRSMICAADDARNSYGIKLLSFTEGERIIEIIQRVIKIDSFSIIGSNYYEISWVFLLNGTPVGYIRHKKTEMIIHALYEEIRLPKNIQQAEFHFQRVSNSNLENYLNELAVDSRRLIIS